MCARSRGSRLVVEVEDGELRGSPGTRIVLNVNCPCF